MRISLVSRSYMKPWCILKSACTCSLVIIALVSSQLVFSQIEQSEESTTTLKMKESTNITQIILLEQGDKLALFNNASCSLNDQDKMSLDEQNNPWQNIVSKPYLEKLSGLAILEEVKQRAQQSRMIMEIDTDAETKLIIQSGEQTQSIALYSIDLMHSTYPNARMLSQLMEVVKLVREAKLVCSPVVQ